MSVALNLTLIFIFIIVYWIYCSLSKWQYWKNKGVPFIKPIPFIGNLWSYMIGKTPMSELIVDFYTRYPKEPYFGIYQFGQPILFIRNLDLAKSVTIKHFENFQDHSVLMTQEGDSLWQKTLFASHGERWRDLRQTLSPIFTGSKLRSMFILMEECMKQMNVYLNQLNSDKIPVELRDICSRVTNDVIASTAFGIRCDSLNNPKNEFLLNGRKLADFTGLRGLLFLVAGLYPFLARLLQIKMVPDSVAAFFRQIINETVKLRQEKNVTRPDLINLLVLSRKEKLNLEDYIARDSKQEFYQEQNTEKKSSFYLTDEDITAQAIIFFLGGFDTVSVTMCFAGYELAVNQSIQKKLRQEIIECHNKNNGQLKYEDFVNIKYLDMVVNETLRKWPQATWIERKCTKSIQLDDLTINTGDICWVPVYALHMDPTYYKNPKIFDPERFNETNIQKIPNGAYLPFGNGPRNCIGSRFALLEIKIFLYYLLLDFEIVPTHETDIPLEISTKTVMFLPKNGFKVEFRKLAK